MATTDLKLDEPGSLPRPGPVGRIVRLSLGVVCLLYVSRLYQTSGNLIAADGHIRSVVWNGVLPGLLLISYVVNIGFSRSWKKWPAIISAAALLAIAMAGYLLTDSAETVMFACAVWAWELYLFSHLGVAFVLSAVIATPGCEMRAFHDLYSRLTGTSTKEHYCPIGPLHPIDQWEAARADH